MAQIEGAGLFALSIALYEELKFENGAFTQKNFDEYKMLRLKDIPEIDIELIETGGHPTGLGEVGGIATAPAIAAITNPHLRPIKLITLAAIIVDTAIPTT